MTISALFLEVEKHGGALSLRPDGGARLEAPAGAIPERLFADLRKHRDAVAAVLRARAARRFDAGAAYDPAAARIEAERLFAARQIDLEQFNYLRACADRAETARPGGQRIAA